MELEASLVAQWWRVPLPMPEDTGLISGLGIRSHMPRAAGHIAPQLLRLCSGAWEPWLLSQLDMTTEG